MTTDRQTDRQTDTETDTHTSVAESSITQLSLIEEE